MKGGRSIGGHVHGGGRFLANASLLSPTPQRAPSRQAGRGFMRIVDLTQPIKAGMPVYPGDPGPELRPWAQRSIHGYDAELLHLGTHTGTHLDAPSHFLPEGLTVAGLSLERCLLPGALLDLRGAGSQIGRAALFAAEAKAARPIAGGGAVLLWTGWSAKWNTEEYLGGYPGLTDDGASWLVERRAGLVGIDTQNIDSPSAGEFPAHRILLGGGVLIVENLARLESLQSIAQFTFQALPLPIVGASGSPVRAVAVIEP